LANTNIQVLQLAHIFIWRGFNFITAPNQPKPAWKTHKIPLHIGEFIQRYTDLSQLLGVGFDQDTDYLMADIDRSSPYHPDNNWPRFKDFLRAMASIGLKSTIVIRSSSSGGIHVYLPLPKQVGTFNLAVAAMVVAIDRGFEVAKGKLAKSAQRAKFVSLASMLMS
jgi:hypothetical protein